MKHLVKLLLVLLIFNATQSQSQEVFYNSGQLISTIKVVDDYLYFIAWNSQRVERISINDSSGTEVVATFEQPWKLAFDETRNLLYCYDVNYLYELDLSQNLPITPTLITNLTGGFSHGMVVHDGLLYFTLENDIYTYDPAVGIDSYEVFYTEVEGRVINPSVYNNELYYQIENQTNPTYHRKIYKIDVTSSNPQKVLVSNSTIGMLQSSHIAGDYLYLGYEITNSIARFDLSDNNLPLTPEIILNGLTRPVLGIANVGSTLYYSGEPNIWSYEDSALSTDEYKEDTTTIYPNPSKDIVYIKNNRFHSYEIYSLNGTSIKKGEVIDQINISDLATGVYLLSLKNDTSVRKVKIVKSE